MKEGRPSLTALLVAVGRGIGTHPDNVDRGAPQIVPRSMGAALGAVQRLGHLGDPARWLARLATAGMVDHVCLRTAAIDAALVDAVEHGCRQLVVLGAGLDARAWRMPELGSVRVFEVDHPATQANKRTRTERMPVLAREVRFAAVDFAREALTDSLAAIGHDPAVPTFWIWEGVTPYLEPAAIAATLRNVAERCGPERSDRPASELAMTYILPELPLPRALHRPVRTAFAMLGEPLHGLMSSRRAADLLREVGFAVVDDTGSKDWATRFSGHAALARPFAAERLVLARRVET